MNIRYIHKLAYYCISKNWEMFPKYNCVSLHVELDLDVNYTRQKHWSHEPQPSNPIFNKGPTLANNESALGCCVFHPLFPLGKTEASPFPLHYPSGAFWTLASRVLRQMIAIIQSIDSLFIYACVQFLVFYR